VEAVARLHAIAGVPLVVGLVAFALVAAVMAAARRPAPGTFDLARRLLLGVIVAVAALGLALSLRGAAPTEGIHWLYGPLLVATLLVPAAVRVDSDRTQSAVLAASGAIAAVLAWRLWSSG
jgi:hypothetical protein